MKRTRGAQDFLDTWGAYCGAPRSVFTGHFDVAVRAELRRLLGYAVHQHHECADDDSVCICGLADLRRYVEAD